MASWHLPWWAIRPRVSFRDITCWHLPPNWPQLFVVSLNGSSVIFSGQPEYNPPKVNWQVHTSSSQVSGCSSLTNCSVATDPKKYFWDSGPVLQYWRIDYDQKTGKTTAGNMMMTKCSQRQKAFRIGVCKKLHSWAGPDDAEHQMIGDSCRWGLLHDATVLCELA